MRALLRPITIAILLLTGAWGASLLAQRLNGGVRLDGVSQGTTVNAPVFTGTASFNGSTGTTGSILMGGSPASWSATPSVTSWTTSAANTLNVAGIAAVSSDGLIIQNTTPATSGVKVQQSPRLTFCGTADNNSVGDVSETDCWKFEVVPVTAGGATSSNLIIGTSIAGGAYSTYATWASGGNAFLGTNIFAGGSGAIGINSRGIIKSSADGLLNLSQNSGATVGFQVNAGTAAPTATTCGTGAATAHSNNMAGEITATGATTCTVTFGAPNWSFTPFCVVEDETTLATLRVSAISTSAMTVTGLTANDKFMWNCGGGSI